MAEVPIDKSVSLQDMGAVAGIAGLVVVAIALFVQLNSKRGVILQVANQTDKPLRLVSAHHVHGDFVQSPDDVIQPNSVSVFTSASVGGSVFTGTEGSCSYQGMVSNSMCFGITRISVLTAVIIISEGVPHRSGSG